MPSHEQLSIKSGFNVNKQLLVETLKEKLLIELRLTEYNFSSFEEIPENHNK